MVFGYYQSFSLSIVHIAPRNPPARFDQLDNIDTLFDEHGACCNPSDPPGSNTIYFVGAVSLRQSADRGMLRLPSISYRAISIAVGLPGIAKKVDGEVSMSGFTDLASPLGCSNEGVNNGEENESRYIAMKQSSFAAHSPNKSRYCEISRKWF